MKEQERWPAPESVTPEFVAPRDCGLSYGAQHCLQILRNYARGMDHVAFPLQSTIAKAMGCEQRTVRTYIAVLKRGGFVRVKQRTGSSALYFLNYTAVGVLAKTSRLNIVENRVSLRRKPTKTLRFAVLKRDKFTCQYCGRSAPEVKLEVDHVVAFTAGGLTSIDNLVTACENCNCGKRETWLTAAK